MDCPICSKPLPFYFAFTSGIEKKSCPACSSIIAATKTSMEKIRKIAGIFSFVSGIPLGIVCCYLWLVALRPGIALVVFFLGIGGVIGCSYIYARANIRFFQHLQDL
jgi:hypothetical protein